MADVLVRSKPKLSMSEFDRHVTFVLYRSRQSRIRMVSRLRDVVLENTVGPMERRKIYRPLSISIIAISDECHTPLLRPHVP